MIVLGLMGCLVVAGLVLALMAFPRRFSVAARYRRVAWIPVTALLIEGALWKPVLTKLSYFAVIPPLLTCIASLFLAAVGATLVMTARERDGDSTTVLRATLIAAIPVGPRRDGCRTSRRSRAVASKDRELGLRLGGDDVRRTHRG
jgi:hypothetical protein